MSAAMARYHPAMADHPIRTDPQIMHGTPCFAGTRVPVKNLFDYIEAGSPLDEFLEDFPSVSREQAVAVPEIAGEMVNSWYNPGMDNSPVQSDPEILSGTPCFAGTRVPVKNLFDYLARGRTLDYFLSQVPTVTREQALAVLDLASRKVAQPAPAA